MNEPNVNPILLVMERTMVNLELIEQHAEEHGLFEVTQIVNSFIGAVAHPWEKLKPALDQISIAQAVAASTSGSRHTDGSSATSKNISSIEM